MAINHPICSIINNKYSENDVRITLFYLASKKQNDFIDILYYILEDDTPLFFEIFGGQTLKIPTKSEFLRVNKKVKIFLYIIDHLKSEDPFKLASYKFDLYLDKIANIFITCYEFLIKDKPENNIDLKLTSSNIDDLNCLYNKALELKKLIQDSPELNKKYTVSKKNRSDSCCENNKEEEVCKILIDEEKEQFNEIEDVKIEEDEESEEESEDSELLNEKQENFVQLSLF